MTEQTRRNTNEDRCDKCGTIRITLDEPIELTESDEILQDTVWGVYRQTRLVDGEFFMYIDKLFYTESSALEELQRQMDEFASTAKEAPRRLDAHSWIFEGWAEVFSVGKVEVRL